MLGRKWGAGRFCKQHIDCNIITQNSKVLTYVRGNING